jgi:3-deoxy-D-manno-octulosonate 8-phosphate phosphatase (KDO 8-P phosphatase)
MVAGLRMRLARVRLVVLDVDGTLTDGRIGYVGSEELQTFHVHDGAGIVRLREAGVEVAWISGRGSRATETRAGELGVRELHLRVASKARALQGIQERLHLAREETLAMGDDLADLELAAHAALLAVPANARPELRARAERVSRAAGGAGAVRELADAILAAKALRESPAARARREEK